MKSMKIFHGPITIGGIGWHLAEGQRKKGFNSDCIVYGDNGFRQLHHINLNIHQYGRLKRSYIIFRTFFRCAQRYSIFHFYSATTLLPYNLDLPILKLLGKKMVMTYCGSDIRLIRVVKRTNRYTHLLKIGLNDRKYDRLKILRMWWQNLWIHRFTAARNLYEHAITVIPECKVANEPWLNNIGFDVANVPDPKSLTTNKIPKIIHAPSNRGIKGSEYVARAIETLRQRGLEFKYQELHGVPNDEVQTLINSSDIVVDQLLLGGIGTLAFEGMGYGKPVLAYIPEIIVQRYMPDCPVYNSTIDNLADRLEELIRQPEKRLKLGERGIAFVKKTLDYENIQHSVIKIYEGL